MSLFYRGELKISQKTIRCSSILNNTIAVGTFDKEVFLLTLNEEGLEIEAKFNFFEELIYSINWLSHENILIGCQKGFLYKIDRKGEPILINNSSVETICSIDSVEQYVATGHWNGVCMVRNSESLEPIKSLEGHTHAVCVKFIAENKLASGSQNGILRIWNLDNFSVLHSLKAHDDIIRQIFLFGSFLYSCSNDGRVNCYDEQLNLKHSRKDHDSFIFALSVFWFEDGLLTISGGESCELVLAGEQGEVARVPTKASIWSICYSADLSKIVVSCEDGVSRVFSIQNNKDSIDLHENYIRSLTDQNVNKIDLTKAPLVSEMNTILGQKEGQTKIFNNSGKGEVFCWKEGRWEYVGEVVDQPKPQSKQQKMSYPGDSHFEAGDYDYVFTIETDSGVSSQLPYNIDQSAEEASFKFLSREGLSQALKPQIIDFIEKNAGKQKQVLPPSLKGFPIVDFHFHSGLNRTSLQNKLKELNNMIPESNTQAEKLSTSELIILDNILDKIESIKDSVESSEFQLISSKLINWKTESGIFVLDLLRQFVLHPDSPKLFLDNKVLLYILSFFKYNNPKYTNLILKVMTNFSKHCISTLLFNFPLLSQMIDSPELHIDQKSAGLLVVLLSNVVAGSIQTTLSIDFGLIGKVLEKIDYGFIHTNELQTTALCVLTGNLTFLSQKKQIHSKMIKALIDSKFSCNGIKEIIVNSFE